MKTRIIAVLLALSLALTLFAGCTKTEVPAAGDTSFTVTDMAGREVSFDAPVERVVALTAADCEILYALGAGDMLVGRGEYCDYPDGALSKPVVSSGAETNIEEIIALGPQVVIMNTMAQTEEQADALEAAGIRVVVSQAQDIDGVYTAITLIGDITGKQPQAEELISGMKSAFEELKADSSDTGLTVYYEVSSVAWGDPWTAGSGTFMDEIGSMLGLTNIFSDVSGWAAVSQEQVIERNPDIIVTVEMYYGEGPNPVEEILSREAWQSVDAIENGAVYNADGDAFTRPGPRLVDAARSLYEFLSRMAAGNEAA